MKDHFAVGVSGRSRESGRGWSASSNTALFPMGMWTPNLFRKHSRRPPRPVGAPLPGGEFGSDLLSKSGGAATSIAAQGFNPGFGVLLKSQKGGALASGDREPAPLFPNARQSFPDPSPVASRHPLPQRGEGYSRQGSQVETVGRDVYRSGDSGRSCRTFAFYRLPTQTYRSGLTVWTVLRTFSEVKGTIFPSWEGWPERPGWSAGPNTLQSLAFARVRLQRAMGRKNETVIRRPPRHSAPPLQCLPRFIGEGNEAGP